jgi:hypothetical protein
VDWVQIWGCWVHWHIFNEYLKGKLKKNILGVFVYENHSNEVNPPLKLFFFFTFLASFTTEDYWPSAVLNLVNT